MTGDTGKERRHEQNWQEWYEVEVEGNLSPDWFDWLDGWGITFLPNGNTLLSGRVRDQPALHGLFARIRDLNLKMVSLRRGSRPQFDETQGMKKEGL